MQLENGRTAVKWLVTQATQYVDALTRFCVYHIPVVQYFDSITVALSWDQGDLFQFMAAKRDYLVRDNRDYLLCQAHHVVILSDEDFPSGIFSFNFESLNAASCIVAIDCIGVSFVADWGVIDSWLIQRGNLMPLVTEKV